MLEEPTLCPHFISLSSSFGLLFSLGVFPGRSVCVSAQSTHSLPIGEAAVSPRVGEYCPVLASLMIAPTSNTFGQALLYISSSPPPAPLRFFLLFFSLYSFCFVCCSRTDRRSRGLGWYHLSAVRVCVRARSWLHSSV